MSPSSAKSTQAPSRYHCSAQRRHDEWSLSLPKSLLLLLVTKKFDQVIISNNLISFSITSILLLLHRYNLAISISGRARTKSRHEPWFCNFLPSLLSSKVAILGVISLRKRSNRLRRDLRFRSYNFPAKSSLYLLSWSPGKSR